MTYIGKVANGTVVLPPEVHLPEGIKVEVTPLVTKQEAEDFTEGILQIAKRVQGLPSDLAERHDFYLHGHFQK